MASSYLPRRAIRVLTRTKRELPVPKIKKIGIRASRVKIQRSIIRAKRTQSLGS